MPDGPANLMRPVALVCSISARFVYYFQMTVDSILIFSWFKSDLSSSHLDDLTHFESILRRQHSYTMLQCSDGHRSRQQQLLSLFFDQVLIVGLTICPCCEILLRHSVSPRLSTLSKALILNLFYPAWNPSLQRVVMESIRQTSWNSAPCSKRPRIRSLRRHSWRISVTLLTRLAAWMLQIPGSGWEMPGSRCLSA